MFINVQFEEIKLKVRIEISPVCNLLVSRIRLDIIRQEVNLLPPVTINYNLTRVMNDVAVACSCNFQPLARIFIYQKNIFMKVMKEIWS